MKTVGIKAQKLTHHHRLKMKKTSRPLVESSPEKKKKKKLDHLPYAATQCKVLVARSMMIAAGDKAEGMLRLQMVVPLFLCPARLIGTFNFVPAVPLLPEKGPAKKPCCSILACALHPPKPSKVYDLGLTTRPAYLPTCTFHACSYFGPPFLILLYYIVLWSYICQSILLMMNWIHENEFWNHQVATTLFVSINRVI